MVQNIGVCSCARPLKHAYAKEMGGIAIALNHASAKGRVNFMGYLYSYLECRKQH
jgi:hypothetical protein